VLASSVDGSRAWYPSVIGESGSTFGGNDMTLYYADRFHWPDIRHLAKRRLVFERYD
jgi:hypothetical protein